MDVIYSLIPGMMFFGVLLVVILIFAVKKGQYEDMEGSGNRILLDDDEDMMPHLSKPRDTAQHDTAKKSTD
ncbi:MAG: cbb3-type cytochrome oxidase assembly protein CcoS [Gallionella sp.]|nr:cbb3-type cytochrome oxidase assembly protein CcoS [Gallionella sp.]